MSRLHRNHVTRRSSLTALVTAGVAGIISGSRAGVAKQSVAKKARKKCQSQENQCVAALTVGCNPTLDCATLIPQCCAFTAQCDIAGFFTCANSFENAIP